MTRRILITGASTGIGAATALTFAETGAIIGLHYNQSESAARDVAQEVERKGARAVLLQGDLCRQGPCDVAVVGFVREAGGIDILINNAGSLIERRSIEQVDWPYLEHLFELNVFSVFYITKLCVPFLRKGTDPSIVNVGSIAAYHGSPSSTVYGATKAALHSMTRGLATDLAPAIRVNCVAPGVIDTPFHRKFTSEERMKTFVESTPLKRTGTAEEVAGAIYYLCSPAAAFITGETVSINGGLNMAP